MGNEIVFTFFLLSALASLVVGSILKVVAHQQMLRLSKNYKPPKEIDFGLKTLIENFYVYPSTILDGRLSDEEKSLTDIEINKVNKILDPYFSLRNLANYCTWLAIFSICIAAILLIVVKVF